MTDDKRQTLPRAERLGIVTRMAVMDPIERAEGDHDDRRVSMTFSSEEPVERFFGMEILSHDREAIDLSWFESRNAPLLLDHDRGKQIGVIERVELTQARKARATVRFGRSALAQEVYQDVVDGIRRNTSVGYQIRELERTKVGRNGDPDEYTATKWRPDEISIVSVPADTRVGVGRSDELSPTLFKEGTTMSEVKTDPAENKPADKPELKRDEAPKFDATPHISKARDEEVKRALRIRKYGELAGKAKLAEQCVIEGADFDEAVRRIDEARAKDVEVTQKQTKDTTIGMSDKDVRRFSVLRAINALGNPSDRQAQEAAAFEFEVSAAASKRYGTQPEGILIPDDVLRTPNGMKADNGQRDLSAGTPTAGGHTVATELLAGSFIDLLRNRSAVFGMGATSMMGLVGDIAIPKQTGGATAGWVSTEGGDVSEQNQTFGQVTMTPKTLGAFTDITRQLRLQSSIDIENLVIRDLSIQTALEIDRAALYGTGASGQPTGLNGVAGVNRPEWSVAPTWSEVVEAETSIYADNADIGSMWWCIPASTKGLLKTTQKVSGEPAFLMADDGTINGYRHMLSNQVSDFEAFFGVWSNLLVGMWGGLDLLVDPYTASKAATWRIVVHQSVDVAVRYAQCFAYLTRASNSGENV